MARPKPKQYVVIGPPGTGKTTYLARKVQEFALWAYDRNPQTWQTDILVCSLTRTAAAEIASRSLGLPPEQTGTLHSHAYRALGSPEIAEAHIDEFNQQHPTFELSSGFAGVADIDNLNAEHGAQTRGDEVALEYNRLRASLTPTALWPRAVREFGNAWESWKQSCGYLDFADLIDTAYDYFDSAPRAPRVVVCDEAQDFSAAEMRLARKWGLMAGNLVMVGDPDQAIYEWRGAAPGALLEVPEEHRNVLGQSYRLPRRVRDFAMKWRGYFRNPHKLNYSPRNAEGEVVRSKGTRMHPRPVVDLIERELECGRSVMVMASCSFFLPQTITELKRRAIPFANPWRRIRGDWNPIVMGRGVSMARRVLDFLRIDPCSYGAKARMWTRNEVKHWYSVCKASGFAVPGSKGKFLRECDDDDLKHVEVAWEDMREGVRDECLKDLVNRLAEGLKADCKPERVRARVITWWLDKIIASKRKTAEYSAAVAVRYGPRGLENEPRCYVGTIHSFKGAEADTVIVYPDLSPSGYRAWMLPEARDSVVRLFYVAVTRAREKLVICQAVRHSPPLEGLCTGEGGLT